MLRRAGFRARQGTGTLLEYELALVATAPVESTPLQTAVAAIRA
jgi:hypothetical protein